MEAMIEQLKKLNLKEDRVFPNYNYDSVNLSKAFLFYYDKLKSKNVSFEFFNGLDLEQLRRYVENYSNSIRRKFTARKNITRFIAQFKNNMCVFISIIEGRNDDDTFEGEIKDFL